MNRDLSLTASAARFQRREYGKPGSGCGSWGGGRGGPVDSEAGSAVGVEV